MIKHNQHGAVNGVAISLIFSIVLLVAAIGFGGWAFSSRQDYKSNADQKIAAAVTVAKQQESSAKDKQFAEDAKNPLKTYNGSAEFGSIVLQYPKTWSGLVDESSGSDALVDGYFYPNVLPSVSNEGSVFALRMKVISQAYSETAKTLADGQNSDTPAVITPYALPKVPKIVGVMVTGSLPDQQDKTGVMVVLPLRNQTLEVWTEGTQFTADFTNNILPNFSFSP